jgi:threonine synthase
VTIVGAGNAAQVMAALITHNGSRVHMYVPKKKLMLMVAQRIIITDMAFHSR